MSENIPEIDTEMVAYAVAVTDKNNQSQIKLIAKWSDLKNIKIDESADLSQVNLTTLKKQLHHFAREEFDPTRAVKRLENYNLKSAIAQKLMNLICIKGLLLPIGVSENDTFWTVVKNIEDLVNEKERLMVPKCPVNLLQIIKNDLLTDLQIPQTGEYVTINLPIHFISSALDEGFRIADAMKVKKSELTVRMVRDRIDREIKKMTNQYKVS